MAAAASAATDTVIVAGATRVDGRVEIPLVATQAVQSPSEETVRHEGRRLHSEPSDEQGWASRPEAVPGEAGAGERYDARERDARSQSCFYFDDNLEPLYPSDLAWRTVAHRVAGTVSLRMHARQWGGPSSSSSQLATPGRSA